MKLSAIALLAILPAANIAQTITPEAAADLTADPRFRAALDAAIKCSIQRVADYINAGSREPAETLSSAAITYCSQKWQIAAAVEAKIGPEYGIALSSLEFFKINEESYYPGVAAAAVEFRMPKKIR